MKYSLGLDIGTASVGWAVINEDKKRIEDLGVRIFERPENPQNGASLALPRREKRSIRRRLKRRRQRLDYLKEFFVEKGLLPKEEIEKIFQYKKGVKHSNPYILREKAFLEKVTNDELFVALYHIAKRRGYKSNRKKIEEKDSYDGKKVLGAISENQKLLIEYDGSVAKTLNENEKFAKNKRNKADSYENSFIRADFDNEIRTILKTQGWSEEWIFELLDSDPKKDGKPGLFYQRPFMTKDLIEKMRGKCQFEKDEPRASRASYSFEIFRLASDLAHLTYNSGERLTPEEINLCIKVAKNTVGFKYSTIKKALDREKDEKFKFDYIRGKQKDSEAETEKNDFGSLRFYHAVKKALKNLPNEWNKIETDVDLFDEIGMVLTCNKDDVALEKALKNLGLSGDVISALMGLSFAGFGHLSIKALRKITPFIINGLTYDKAVEAAYPGQFSEKLSGSENQLPPLSELELAQLTNPVVKRAISQTRKVINAVIRKYSAPTQIKIECTNELAKNFKDRKRIENQQKENQERNEVIKRKLEELGHTSPTGQQIIKYKLYEQQVGQCAYCGKALGPEIFGDEKLAEIDHIIPFSICGNDSLSNKVLVCAKCNQDKKNHTPFQVWGQTERWPEIIERVNGMFERGLAPKKNRILAEKIPKDDWSSHALNDTRYAVKFLQQYIKRNLKFSEEGKGVQRVLLPTGFITSYARKILGLSKSREENNCHHAVDACIVGILSQGQIQKFSLWNKYKELGAQYHVEAEEAKIDLAPWENFAKEVRVRSGMSYDVGKIENLKDFRDKFRDFESYDEEFLNKIHPMFVSRMPKRGMVGSAHKDTFRSPKEKGEGLRLSRKKLSEIKDVKELDESVLPESDIKLYEQLKKLVAEEGINALKNPIYKGGKEEDKNGRPLAPVRTIKVYTKEPMTSGILINHGTQYVNNGDTVCLDIYRRKNTKDEYKFYGVPVYVHSLKAEKHPVLPTPNGRSKLEKEELDKIREKDGRIFAMKENGFEFVARVFPNDYIKLYRDGETKEGYYVKYGISGGALTLLPHNSASKDDSDFIFVNIGTIQNVEKLDISVLGDNYKFE